MTQRLLARVVWEENKKYIYCANSAEEVKYTIVHVQLYKLDLVL